MYGARIVEHDAMSQCLASMTCTTRFCWIMRQMPSAGKQWRMALDIFHSLPGLGLTADAHTYSSVISALAKGKLCGQWEIAWEVCSHP